MIKQIKAIDTHHLCACGITLIEFTDDSNEQDSRLGVNVSDKGYWCIPEEKFQEGELVDLVLLEKLKRCSQCGWYYSVEVKKL